MNRRGFLKSVLAAGVAPAFVGSSVLMPLTKILSADGVSFVQSGTGFTQLAYAAVLHGDGIRDDTAAMQAFLDGLPVLYQGRVVQDKLGYGHFLIKRQLEVRRHDSLIHDSRITFQTPPTESAFRIHESAYRDGNTSLRNIYMAAPSTRSKT